MPPCKTCCKSKMPPCLFMIRWRFPIFTGKINDMEYQIIPIESIKRIEIWLKDETGFSRSMLHNELDYISDVYLLPKQFAEVQDLYLSIRKEEQNIPYPNRGTDEERYEFSMTVGKNLILESGSYQAEYIETLWNTYNTNEDETCIQQDQDIFSLLSAFTINTNRHAVISISGITLQTLCRCSIPIPSVPICCVFTRYSTKRKRRNTIPLQSNTTNRR